MVPQIDICCIKHPLRRKSLNHITTGLVLRATRVSISCLLNLWPGQKDRVANTEEANTNLDKAEKKPGYFNENYQDRMPPWFNFQKHYTNFLWLFFFANKVCRVLLSWKHNETFLRKLSDFPPLFSGPVSSASPFVGPGCFSFTRETQTVLSPSSVDYS